MLYILLDIKVSKNQINTINNTIVFNPPKKNPKTLSVIVKEVDPRNRNNNTLVINLEIIIEQKNINTAEIKNIHLVLISKNDDKNTVKSKQKERAKNTPMPISINSNIASKSPFLIPKIALSPINKQKRISITILR